MRLRGFTLIELLTVIAVIAVLAGILIPVVGNVRERGLLTSSISQQRQLALALLQHAQGNRGKIMASVPDGQHWCRVEFHEFLTGRIAETWSEMDESFICDAVPEFDAEGQEVSKQERTYGFNAHLAAEVGYVDSNSETPLATIAHPSKAVLLLDFPVPNFNRGQLLQTAKVEALRERFEEEVVNLAHVDGHMSSVTVDELLALSEDGPGTPEGRKFFWGR